jgi:hypothetical protein
MSTEEAKLKTVEQTLAELVSIDSRSSLSNLEIIKYLSARVEAMGFCARLLPYTDERGVKKFNLVAKATHGLNVDDVAEIFLNIFADVCEASPQGLIN